MIQDQRRANERRSDGLYGMLSLASAIRQANLIEEQTREDEEDGDGCGRKDIFRIVIVCKASNEGPESRTCYVFDRIELDDEVSHLSPSLRICRRSELSPIEALRKYEFTVDKYGFYKSTWNWMIHLGDHKEVTEGMKREGIATATPYTHDLTCYESKESLTVRQKIERQAEQQR